MADGVLKAYEISDDYEGYGVVVFAANNATARRAGASDLGIELKSVDHCLRAPHFDQYAPGPIPALTLIEHGWWFECRHCGCQVSKDMDEDIIDVGLDPADFVPRSDGKTGIYCSASCECADHMKNRGQEEAEDALREVFEAKFQGATIVDIHCYDGPALKAKEYRRGATHVVTFTFPGSNYSSQWHFGDKSCLVPQIDQDAFSAWHHVSKGGQQ